VPKVTVLRQSCKGIDDCGICIFVCPKEILIESGETNELGYCPPNVVNESACTGCQSCMISCPDFAIVVEIDRSGPPEKKGHGEG
jgi:2-oxoglutarate ferredoxin oxidoreductase subunit delta